MSLCQTPGPGTYPAPSEFGIYRAQEKYIKENERAEGRRKTALTSRSGRNSTSQMTERSVKIRFASPIAKPISEQDKLKKNSSEVSLAKDKPTQSAAKQAK